jgi:hypothetical protein
MPAVQLPIAGGGTAYFWFESGDGLTSGTAYRPGNVGLNAGSNAIGTVVVSTLPSLPAGSNTIGNVGVSSLPSLPTGTNAIGSITNTTFASTQSGTWNIGTLATITNVVPVSVPRAASGTVSNASQQTSATGSSFVTLASATCSTIEVFNYTGTTIEYRRNGAGVAIPIPTNSTKVVTGIANANEIGFRRSDASNTQVTFFYEVYS